MHCYITKINQSYSLTGEGAVAMSAVIRLPGGSLIEVPLKEEQVNALIAAKGEDADTTPAPEVDRPGLEDSYGYVESPYEEEDEVSPGVFVQEEEPLRKQLEPDPELEGMFQAEPEQDQEEEDEPGAPVKWAELPDELIRPEVKQVFKDMQVQHVLPANVLAQLVESVEKRLAQQAAPAQPKKTVGRVMPASAPRRTVPKDEYGYPIVQNANVAKSTDYDPGEIPDLDEDGVAQM